MVDGAIWMVAMRWTIRLIGLVNTAIIARLLLPADFGLVALAMIAVDLLVTITDGDVEMALIRAPHLDRERLDTGWTLKIFAGMATMACLALAAGPVAQHFGDERIATVIRIAALRPLIMGFENIDVVSFRHGLRFSNEFRYLVLQRLITFLVGLTLVLIFRNYLALAWSMPAAALVSVAASYAAVPGRPRLCLRHWHEFWRFSRWQMLFNSARLVGERWDQFIIGQLAGVAMTGIYVVGFDLAMMPTREIMLPAGRALLPAYSKIAHDRAALARNFHSVLGFAAAIACPAGLGIASIADDAVVLVLGEQWRPAVPFIRGLGLFGALEGLWLMLDPFLIALQHERTLAVSNLAFSGLTVLAVSLSAVFLGVESIPVARILVMAAVLSALLFRIWRWQWLSARLLVGALWRPLAAALLMAGAIDLLHPVAEWRLARMICEILAGAGTYLAALLGLWRLSGRPDGVETTVVRMAAEAWGRRRQAG